MAKTPKQTAGQKDGQILFHSALLATAGGPTSTTAVDWHLKVKDIEYYVSLTKNYCIKISMPKISSIHKLLFKIQQILRSHKIVMPIFHTHSKIIESTFSFPEFAPAWSSFHQFILEIQSVLESCDQTGHTHF